MAIQRENYINIQGWMVTDLKLKGNSLLIYAIIYGFSQEDGQRFTGSLQYLADWTNSTKRGVLKSLKALLDEGLIAKEETTINGVKFCTYHRTKFTGGGEQSSPGYGTKFTEGMEQSSPNNLFDNSINNLTDKDSAPDKPAPRSRFVKPTLEEITAYCRERKNKVDPDKFLSYYESNGWKVGRNPMKDWKAAVRNWERSSFGATPQAKRGTGASWDDLDHIIP